jgi:CRP-like cAMP-binding protein
MPVNKLLSRLSRADTRLLEPHLQVVELPVRKQLQARNDRVRQVYFLENGIASVLANGNNRIEIGLIGREGMTGLSVVLGDGGRVPHETCMQVVGSAQRLSADDLRAAISASVTLHQVLLGYVHSFLTQVAETALANACSRIEERLARWLLMAHDRVDSDELALTHETLSIMLGVRRSGVTTSLQELERKGFIAHRRGIITILDREGLENDTNGTYIAPNGRYYRRDAAE